MANRNHSRRLRWNPPQEWVEWSEWLSIGLHGRCRWRLPALLMGLLFAEGRRTVTTWLRAAGLQDDFSAYYYFIAGVGRKSEAVAARLVTLLLARLAAGRRVLLALDDSPTRRYGLKVEGAGLHRNPTSGPDDRKFVYGHIWVTLAWVLRHRLWHAIALPLLARLYVKQKDVPRLPQRYRWEFHTKLELAIDLVSWAVKLFGPLKKPIWLAVDGGYAYRPFLKRVLPLGVTVVSRLRKDAALRTLPPPRRPGQRGATRKYGTGVISLARRAAQKRGWKTIECVLYGGEKVVKTYKTFLATYPVVGGVIRVVLVREESKWEAFFCTDPEASVQEILEAFADRSAIEQGFHDLKEIWGAGQQQVRNLWCNIGAFHLNLWMHTLVELWAWKRRAHSLRDRRRSPWDDASRRPSHANRRKALRQACLKNQFKGLSSNHLIPRKLKHLIHSLTQLLI